MEKKLENKLVKKINELYITNRKKYLIMNKDGEYRTVFKSLTDSLIRQHLQHKNTLGIFSGKQVTKFICFDLDIPENKQLLNWAYYLLIECLEEIGIPNDYLHLASSGNKGYHLLLFLSEPTSLSNIKKLFDLTMKSFVDKLDSSISATIHNEKGHSLELDFGQIELRCTDTQGVKLELGVNFKNKDNITNKCYFMDKETLNIINEMEYFLAIFPMPKEEFNNLLKDISETENKKLHSQIYDEKLLIETTLKEPRSHKINKDENETISHILNLLENGLQMKGTRHNSVFKISRYFRYMGLEELEAEQELKKWMSQQDKNYYSSTLEEALEECERLNKLVYEKDYTIVGEIKNITISKNEIKQIMQVKDKNAKIILYAMLIHSKRYSNAKGVFYLSFNQIEEMTDLGIKGSLANIKKLEEMGLIEVVERNVYRENTYMKKPNKYKVRINVEECENETVVEIVNNNTKLDYKELYYDNVIKLFDNI